MVIHPAVLAGLVMSLAAAQADPAAQGQRILIHTSELIPLRVQSTIVAGSIDGRPVEVKLTTFADPARGTLQVSAAMSGSDLGVYSVPMAQVPKLDLSSAEYRARTRESVVEVELRFGDPTNCFANYDGRSRFTVQFESGDAPRAFLTGYPACVVEVTELPRAQQ